MAKYDWLFTEKSHLKTFYSNVSNIHVTRGLSMQGMLLNMVTFFKMQRLQFVNGLWTAFSTTNHKWSIKMLLTFRVISPRLSRLPHVKDTQDFSSIPTAKSDMDLDPRTRWSDCPKGPTDSFVIIEMLPKTTSHSQIFILFYAQNMVVNYMLILSFVLILSMWNSSHNDGLNFFTFLFRKDNRK